MRKFVNHKVCVDFDTIRTSVGHFSTFDNHQQVGFT